MKIRILPILIAAIAIAAISIIAFRIANSNKAGTAPKETTTAPTVGPKDMPAEFPAEQIFPTKIIIHTTSLSQETKQAIAGRVFTWLSGLLDNSNNFIYPSSVKCNETEKCEPGGRNNASVFASVWSRFQRYKVSKNAVDLRDMTRDLNTFSNTQLVPAIQNDFWGCRFIYELWQSPLPEIVRLKNQMQSLCQNIVNNPDDLDEIDRVINENTFQEANLDELLAGRRSASPFQPKKDYYVEYAGLSSEYVSRYHWLGDTKDLSRAKLYFAKAAGLFNINERKQKTIQFPVLGIAALDLYNAENNSKYLDFATLLIQEKQSESCQSLLDCALTAFFADEFFLVSQNGQYKKFRDTLVETAVAGGYDEQRGAFHNFNTTNLYPTHENFILAGLLVKP